MKRKLLILAALLGVCALGFHKPVNAIPDCSSCAGGGECVCDSGTANPGMVADCDYWMTTCFNT